MKKITDYHYTTTELENMLNIKGSIYRVELTGSKIVISTKEEVE